MVDRLRADDRLTVPTPGHAGWPRYATAVLGSVGAIGMVLMTCAGVILGPHGPTGSAIERDVVALAPAGVAGKVIASLCMAFGLAAVLGAWIVLGLLLRRGASLRPLFHIAVAWSTPLVLGPPIFSRDVYSYAAQGLMVNRHLDPYTAGPWALGGSRYVMPVSTTWLGSRSPYGPLFLRVDALIVRIAGNSVFNAVVLLRLLELVGVVLIAAGLPKLAEALGKDPARALWLGLCNPLVLFHFVGGAHNDALMMGLLVSGLALAVNRHPMLGVAFCTLAATVKAPAVIAVVFIVADVVRRAPKERRAAVATRYGAVAAGGFGVVSMVTRIGWGWIGALGVPGTNHSLLTPTTFVAHIASDVVGHDNELLSLARGAGTLVTLAGIAWLVWRAPQLGTVRACGLALALLVALGPIVLPWYALWGVIVLAASGRRIERGYAIFASVVLALMVQPSGSAMPDVMLMGAVLLLSGALVAISWAPVRRWVRHDLAAAIEAYRHGGEISRWVEPLRIALPFAASLAREPVERVAR